MVYDAAFVAVHAPTQTPPRAFSSLGRVSGRRDTSLEREAHRMADRVSGVSSDGSWPRSVGRLPVSRLTGDHHHPPLPPSVGRVLATSGRPLALPERREAERRFGADFGDVRLHSDSAADASTRDVGARAFTIGHHIVLGAGSEPGTPVGRRVLAHELTHVLQQRDCSLPPQAPARLQRWEASDVFEAVAGFTLGPQAGAFVHEHADFVNDLVASVRESPSHVAEFFSVDVWNSIKDHWPSIVAVTAGLLLAESAVAALTAVPEPTLLTKVVAAILQIVILAVLGYFAAIELIGVYEQGSLWLRSVHAAHGDPALISDASRAFVRMVWHIVMAVLVLAGVRARVRGTITPPPPATRAASGIGEGTSSVGSGASGGGATVTPISSHPGFRPRTPTVTQPPRTSAFGPGGTARRLDPVEVAPARPVIEPVVEPVPAPAPAVTPVRAPVAGTPPTTGSGVQPTSAVAAGVAAAEEQSRRTPAAEKVADSNIFMDRIEGGPPQRLRIDTNYLANPGFVLHVPAAAWAEATRVDPHGTQARRLAGVPGGARVLPDVDGDLTLLRPLLPSILSSRFGENDLRIALRAKERAVPLLTAQTDMARQLIDPAYPARVTAVGSVPVEIP